MQRLEPAVITHSSPPQKEVPVAWILAVLLRERRTILAFGLAGIGLAIVIGVAKRPFYTASFSFLPQATQDQGRSGLASIAGQFGIPLGALGGQTQPPQLYAEILKTREVLGPIAVDTFSIGQGQRVPLSAFLGVSGSNAPVVREETMRLLRERIVSPTVDARNTGAVTVRARTRSPEISLQIAQRLLDGLHQFNKVTRQSQAAEERRFTEGRLEAARASLRAAEDELQRFLQGNRQFASPQLQFQQDRLEREVAQRQQVVMGLAQQYEDARIREVRDTPVITLLERPTLPVVADPRGRVRLLLVTTFASIALGVALVLTREGWRRQQAVYDDPSYAMLESEWRRVRGMFRRS